MPAKAKYTGPHTSVLVELPSGAFVEVEQGHQLPTKHEGEDVPAALRDGLLESNDWSEVDAPAKKEG